MKTVHKDIVSALIFAKDGKFFQGKKDPKRGGVYVDYWHIPGGRVNEGEDKDTALVREIKEEVGIDIAPYGFKMIDDVGRGEAIDTEEQVMRTMTFYIYRIDLDQDSADVPITLSDDLVEYRWTELKELKDLKITPPSVELFTRLGWL
ncbi:MAG: NUDIX hydrolase [Patescibacteria group bacterium]